MCRIYFLNIINMVNFEGKYDEYIESNSVSDVGEIENAKTIAKLDCVKNNLEKQVEKETKVQTESLRKGILETKGKVDFTTPDSINHFYRIEWWKPVFQLNKVKEYLEAVFARLSRMKNQKFWDISKENNFTWTILAVQIALKAMESDPKNSKKYGIGKINGKYDDTIDAIKQFQSGQNMRDVDGKPWKNTIKAIIKSLENLINNRKEYDKIKNIVKSNITWKIWILDPDSKSEEITDYIIKWNLWSNLDFDLEKQINDLTDEIKYPLNDDLRKLIEEYKEKGKLNILNKDEKFSNTKYDNLIVQFSKKYSVDPALVKIMMYQESKFNPRARSGGRARWLMQLTPVTIKEINKDQKIVKNVYDPKQNIEWGVKYFSDQLNTFNWNISLALAAYNAGPSKVKKLWNRIPNNTETRNYVKFITEEYNKLKA